MNGVNMAEGKMLGSAEGLDLVRAPCDLFLPAPPYFSVPHTSSSANKRTRRPESFVRLAGEHVAASTSCTHCLDAQFYI